MHLRRNLINGFMCVLVVTCMLGCGSAETETVDTSSPTIEQLTAISEESTTQATVEALTTIEATTIPETEDRIAEGCSHALDIWNTLDKNVSKDKISELLKSDGYSQEEISRILDLCEIKWEKDEPKIPTMNLCDYCSLYISYHDGDGDGYANLQGKSAIEDDFMQKMGGNLTDMQMKTFISGIEYKLSKDQYLSNGDEIVLTITVDEDIKTVFGIELAGGQKSFVVEGLPEREWIDFDPFKNFYIVFDYPTYSPFLSVSQMGTRNDDYYDITYGHFVIDNFDIENQFLKNGDVIKVRFAYDREKTDSRRLIITSTEKEYTISGYDECIKSFDQISNEELNSLISNISSVLERYNSLSDLKYLGYYLFTAKDKPYDKDDFLNWCPDPLINVTYFVFEGTSDDKKVYTLYGCANLYIDKTQGATFLCSNGIHFPEFESAEELQKTLSEKYSDIMNCTQNVSFE